MTEPLTHLDELAKDIAYDRRHERRLNLFFPIEIRGVGRNGGVFNEQTKTSEISESGCRIKSDLPLNRGDVISIRLLGSFEHAGNNKSSLFEIMWIADNPEGRLVGARKLDNEKFWNVTFPPSKPKSHSK